MNIYTLELIVCDQDQSETYIFSYIWKKAYKTEKAALMAKSQILEEYSNDDAEYISLLLHSIYDDEKEKNENRMKQIEEKWPFYIRYEKIDRIDINKIELVEGD